MQSVHRSVLVPFSAARMFALVDDIGRYPEFLPWCGGAQELETHAGGKTARVDIDYHGVRAHFTTDNANAPPTSIVVTLKDGPFRHLHGEWNFTTLAEDACKVEFVLAYEFTTHLLERVVGPVFGHIANSFIDAFVRRAEWQTARESAAGGAGAPVDPAPVPTPGAGAGHGTGPVSGTGTGTGTDPGAAP
jgi:ribosome-associated toxin RatA of RatAB toxin-antitoxin module